MKRLKFLLAFIPLFIACKNTPEKKEAVEKQASIDSVFKNYYEESLKLYPLNATYAGDDRYNDYLPNDISQAFKKKQTDFYNKYKEALLEYDKDSLSKEQKMSYDVLMWECNTNLNGLLYPTELTPINQFSSLPQTIGQLAGGTSAQPFKTVEDYKNWLKRLDDYVVWCDTAIVNMKKGMEMGYVLPKSLTVKVIPQMASFSSGEPTEHLFYTPAKNFPSSFSKAEKDTLAAAYEAMVANKIIPTYKKLEDFFANTYLQASRETAGINQVPRGNAYYGHQIQVYTTTSLEADSIHRLGLSEVKRLEGEMKKVMQQVGFAGDLKDFFQAVRTADELMPFDKPEQVIANFNAIHEKMKPQLNKLFDLTPKTAFEVRRTESFREASASAEYNPGSLDGTRPGIFYVPIPNVKKYNMYSDEDLFLHEAIPGHHYQISLQQENENLPDFRKTLWYSAYGEGWALYSESLGKELGLYDDPYQYFGMLSAEMHRAIRLVVDTGIHTKGWTREEAIQYSLDHEAESEESIIAEIERYMSWPGQALSYKIGQLKIIALRNKAQKELGDAFDIKIFHNKVLESGCIPLKLLEDKINNWIKTTKNG
ncbi:DUF885 domain-containing protein [Galbibacter mesophilus]|uniref:DUF885 domain-containing protein n=1 Tax=Galbibacter mesophilus TaxID=379069 RepID=UPI00191DA5B9|nr:DUF885 domain-containing protein [Galbibacter mesophilus]MCM5661546.1 DUF885 domain-containing protein [Galbibacter mesophilus]